MELLLAGDEGTLAGPAPPQDRGAAPTVLLPLPPPPPTTTSLLADPDHGVHCFSRAFLSSDGAAAPETAGWAQLAATAVPSSASAPPSPSKPFPGSVCGEEPRDATAAPPLSPLSPFHAFAGAQLSPLSGSDHRGGRHLRFQGGAIDNEHGGDHDGEVGGASRYGAGGCGGGQRGGRGTGEIGEAPAGPGTAALPWIGCRPPETRR